MLALTTAIIFITCFLATRNLQMKPKGAQNVMEFIVDFIRGMLSDMMDQETSRKLMPLGLTIIFFVLVGNVIGMVTTIVIGDVSWWKSPTSVPTVALTLAGMVVVLSHYYAVKIKGSKEYWLDYFRPVFFMLPFNIIGEFTRTLTLGLRLFGNMFAGGVLTSIILGMATTGVIAFIGATLPMLAWSAMSLFIAGIQALIFTMLSMVYISNKIND